MDEATLPTLKGPDDRADHPPAEVWLALLPAPTTPAERLSADEAEALAERDPAKEARDARPLSRRDFLRALAASPVHRVLFALEPFVPFLNGRLVLRFFLGLPLMLLPYLCIGEMFDSGVFHARGIATGLAALTLISLIHSVTMAGAVRGNWVVWQQLDKHSFAGYVRWSQLCDAVDVSRDAEAGDAAVAPWIRHEDGDLLCPCPAPSCAGRTISKSAVLQVLSAINPALFGTFTWGVLSNWTFVVFLAGSTWSNPGKVFVVVWGLVALFAMNVTLLFEVVASDVALVNLEARVRNRALRIALAGLVSRCTVSSAGTDAPFSWPRIEPYISVHLGLVPAWRSTRIIAESAVRMLALLVLAMCIIGLIPLIGSGCVPSYIIVAVGLYIVMVLRYLTDAVAANAGVASAGELYRRARSSLSLLLTLYPAAPEAARIRAHEAVLARFEAAAAGDLAKMFGFVVDLALVRGFVATGLTVGVGLFGILRGAGATATLQSVCPI